MKYVFILLVCFPFSTINCLSQKVNISLASFKPPIDTSVFGKWPTVADAQVSADGKFVRYAIVVIQDAMEKERTLILESTDTRWKMEIPAAEGQIIGGAEKDWAVVTRPNDTLNIFTLGTDTKETIPHVSSFKTAGTAKAQWLAYELDSPAKELKVRNLTSGREMTFSNVTEYLFDEQGNSIFLKTEEKNLNRVRVQWAKLSDEQKITIWEGVNAGNFTVSPDGNKLAFLEADCMANHPNNSIWYYSTESDKATLLLKNAAGIDSNCYIENIEGFSKNCRDLYFTIKNKERQLQGSPDAVKVDIWSYKDEKLQSQQLAEVHTSRSYRALMHIDDHRVVRLEYERENVVWEDDSFAIITQTAGDVDFTESSWNPAAKEKMFLCTTKDGRRKPFPKQFGQMSPRGHFLVYYEPKLKVLFSYSVNTGALRNITSDIHTSWLLYGNDMPDREDDAQPYAGWLDETTILLNDQNDIWQVDLTGKNAPIELTGGYGRQHQIVFRLALYGRDDTITADKPLLLTAFDRRNKNNGFYAILPGKRQEPIRLTMGPYLYDVPANIPGLSGEPPVKASNAEAYVVIRMSASESPNYFFTTDFKKYTPLSSIYPEANYNWLRTKLMTWKTLDGKYSKGVLYTPENFNPGKRYPLIIYYYERLADQLNEYMVPDVCHGAINIPWFVSNGYLVFTPDIQYQLHEPGRSAYNAVVSAANYLSGFSYVDKMHIGIQGHSFGGYETNFIVSHSGVFAAAMSASGFTDIVSQYGSIWAERSSQRYFELFQGRIGATLWERPDLYIQNSPIFQANKVSTPLLMMFNKGDDGVKFSQGIEFFTALRRLHKKTWMLQYDEGGHTVNGRSAMDYSIRIAQFFGYYLKGETAPKWMADGVPGFSKGIDTGFEAAASGKEP